MQQILILLTSLAAAGPPSSPPSSGSNNQPSGAAWLTLVCGIASWFILPLVAAVVGVIAGRSELKAIAEGRSPQAGETITKLGYYISLANIILTVVGGCFSIAIIVMIWGGLIAGVGGLAIFGELANSMQ